MISGSDFSDFFNSGGDGTFYVEFVPVDMDSTNYIIRGFGGTSEALYVYSNQPFRNVRSFDGVNATNYGDANNNELNRAAITYDSGNMKGSLNGAALDSAGHDGSLSDQTSLGLGSGPDAPLYLKRVIYWPTSSDRL